MHPVKLFGSLSLDDISKLIKPLGFESGACLTEIYNMKTKIIGTLGIFLYESDLKEKYYLI
jgi:hypothetical protein